MGPYLFFAAAEGDSRDPQGEAKVEPAAAEERKSLTMSGRTTFIPVGFVAHISLLSNNRGSGDDTD